MGIRVGIDLGTTFSACAKIDPATGRPVIIRNNYGESTTPSVLCFEPDGTVLYGKDAKDMQAAGEGRTVSLFKRSMGEEFFALDIFGRRYTAEDLSAILLSKLKDEAERQCGETIDAAVITVPAYFRYKERAATQEAGRRAGLNVIAVLNEPTAAAYAYGLNKQEGSQTILIYDLGGGTFDVTVARISREAIDILGSDGNHELGGTDWDECIARYLLSSFQSKYGVTLDEDSGEDQTMLVIAENAKKQLTSRDNVTVPLSLGGVRGTVDISVELFEAASQHLLGMTKDVTEQLINSIGLTWRDLDGVILVGGSTRMRMVRNYVREMSGREPLRGVDVDEAVALGAAIRANITASGLAVIPEGGRSTALAVQGAKAISDVTAHALGMIAVSPDEESYINKVIIRKNAKIPATGTEPFRFRTRMGENELEVYVLQGDHRRPLSNTVINKYVISGIRKTEEQDAVIDVSYHYTLDGMVEVSAVQRGTGQTLSIRTEPVPEDMSWTDGSPKDLSGEGEAQRIDVLLAVDMSGSMTGDPLAKAKQAMKDFVDQMDCRCVSIGLVPFADRVDCEIPPTDNSQQVKQLIGHLRIGSQYGINNQGHPFDRCYGELMKRNADLRYVVVLTDGWWSCCGQAIESAHRCHRAGIEVIALGFGNADYEFLQKIASTAEFAAITQLSALGGSFSKIARAINEGASGLRAL